MLLPKITGTMIRAGRVFAHLSQDQLAARAGIHRDCLRTWEGSSDAMPRAQYRMPSDRRTWERGRSVQRQRCLPASAQRPRFLVCHLVGNRASFLCTEAPMLRVPKSNFLDGHQID
jgi:hypothetical protein